MSIAELRKYKIVIDSKTGLMWQKKPDGVKRDWDGAKSYCRNLKLGSSDWRLPSKDDLKDMLDKKDLLDQFRLVGWFWSSTTNVYFPENAWSAHFVKGLVSSLNKNTFSEARCVRGGQ